MSMSWTKTVPTAPGRYWWRAPDKYGRADRQQYGLVLVAWVDHYRLAEPSLGAVSICSFNSSFGGELERGGWSYTNEPRLNELTSRYPGIEFWSEPERGPEGFLPELPGKPDWTPPDPKVVEAKREKSAAEAAKREEAEADERAEKIAEAKRTGEVLYECPQCEELWSEDEVVQVRECPQCDDERFNGTDDGRNCPTCNRPFTRKIADKGCPDCLDEDCEVLSDEIPESTRAAHARHCCPLHGCKYKYDSKSCPVVMGVVMRETDSGWCQEPGLVDDPEKCRKPGERMPTMDDE